MPCNALKSIVMTSMTSTNQRQSANHPTLNNIYDALSRAVLLDVIHNETTPTFAPWTLSGASWAPGVGLHQIG